MKKISDKSTELATKPYKSSIAIIVVMFMIVIIKPVSCFSQNNWDGHGVQGNFTWCENWDNNNCPSTWNSTTDLLFNFKYNSSQTSLYYDLPWKEIRSLVYQTTFPSGLNLDGNGNGLDFWHKVENLSSHNQVVNILLSFKGSGAELNATNGNLTFQQPIYNDNNKVFSFYNNNNKSVILSSYIVGNNSVNLNLQSSSGYGIVQINSNMPNLSSSAFSGGININRGEVWFNQGSAINGGTIRVGNGDANICKLYINDADGGTTVTNAITVPVSSSNSYIGGLNTSGSNVFSGNFGLSATTTFENYGGGTLDLQGNISGSVGVNIGRISGTGSSVILYSTNAKTYTGSTNIYGNATLQLGLANVLPSTNSIAVATDGLLKVSANQTIANLNLSGGGSLTVDNGVTLNINVTYTGGAGTVTNNGTVIIAGETAPAITSISPGNGQLSVAFTAGAAAGTTISNYKYSIDNGSSFTACSPAQTTGPIVITDLVNGTSYNVQIKAVNEFGDRTASSTNSATPMAPPTAFNVTGTGSYCAGSLGLAVGLEDSEIGVTYTLFKDNAAQTPTVDGTGEAISFGNQLAGTYTISGTNISGTTPMSGSAILTESPSEVPSVLIVASANPVVSGTSVTFTATPVTTGTSQTYEWYINGVLIPNSNYAFIITTPTNGMKFKVVMTPSGGCFNPATAMAEITMVVTDSPTNSTWDGSSNNEWHNADNWSLGIPNSITDVTIPSGVPHFPTLSNAADCHNITLKSGASILGNNHLNVTGTAYVEREITGGAWHLISSPVAEAKAGVFLHDYLQKWDETTATWTDIEDETTTLNVLQGYSLWETTGGTSVFTGAMNSGPKSIPITYTSTSTDFKGANLLGNPYPSAIDWGQVSGYGAVYYWNGSAYVAYPAGTPSGTGTYGTGSQYIPPMQGFFIVVPDNNPNTFTFTNAMRTHNGASNYYKSTKTLTDGLMLFATNGEYKDKLLIRQNEEANKGFDFELDAWKLPSNTLGISQLWSACEDGNLSIDVHPATEVIQLGFANDQAGTYSIALDEMAGIGNAILEDTRENTFTDLGKGAYSFNWQPADNELRFRLHTGALAVAEKETTHTDIYSYQQTVYVNFNENINGDIYIYNLAGQLITAKESASGSVRIGLTSTGVYMIKVVTEKETLTQKVVIR